MISEQVKAEIEKVVNNKFKDLKDSLDIISLPFKSQYQILTWMGLFDGALLTPLFDVNILIGRTIIIKSIRFVPYADGNFIDISLNDGVTIANETIPDLARLERIFDVYDQGNTFRFIINGVNCLTSDDNRVTSDFFVDNIFYKYPNKIQTIEVSMQALVVDDLAAQTFDNPNGKCFVECYLI
jgi:hypothetical protein